MMLQARWTASFMSCSRTASSPLPEPRRTKQSAPRLMAVTLLTWVVYGVYLALRYGVGLRGRRSAYLVLAGFALVAVARLALPITHFS